MGRDHFREKLMRLLEKIDGNVDAILVEGVRDEKALRRIGVKTEILRINMYGMNILNLVEYLEEKYRGKRIIVLSDFDNEGLRLNRRIEVEIEGRGVKVEKSLREKLRILMAKYGKRKIEEL
ncbi:MAG TPA: hypothetical protein ENG81_04540 [Candidatus Bathyarchaeota archaeon]|nr:hypothetical protein [Candidatus Bathyarchaeota archaeon]